MNRTENPTLEDMINVIAGINKFRVVHKSIGDSIVTIVNGDDFDLRMERTPYWDRYFLNNRPVPIRTAYQKVVATL